MIQVWIFKFYFFLFYRQSLKDKVKLFTSIEEEKKEAARKKGLPPPPKRKSRKLASRFQTQVQTLLCKKKIFKVYLEFKHLITDT